MLRILVVEDDPGNADVIRQMLESANFQVESIHSPGIVDETINNFLPDLILMDIILHSADGRLLCNYIKGKPSTKHIPILLITAMLESEISKIPCLPDATILKPFDYQKLITTVNTLLRKSRRLSL